MAHAIDELSPGLIFYTIDLQSTACVRSIALSGWSASNPLITIGIKLKSDYLMNPTVVTFFSPLPIPSAHVPSTDPYIIMHCILHKAVLY